jgi:transcription initiation factor TFIIA small subunit
MVTNNRFKSLGLSLTDTLDDLINDGRIEPQLAMKILSNYDRVITEVLAEKVRARLTFKVYTHLIHHSGFMMHIC